MASKVNLYNEYTVSDLNWVHERDGIFKIPVSTFSGSDYLHPVMNEIELNKFNYTGYNSLYSIGLYQYYILNDELYINFGSTNPPASFLVLQMAKLGDQIIELDGEDENFRLLIDSRTNNNAVVTDSSGNILTESIGSQAPYHRTYVINSSDSPITIRNAGVSTAMIVAYAGSGGGGGGGKVNDVKVNGTSVVEDGVANIDNPILKDPSEWTQGDIAVIWTNLGLGGFMAATPTLIPVNELTSEYLNHTYILTQPQVGFTSGNIYTVVEDSSTSSGYNYQEVGKTSIPIGNVSDIKYTMASGVLKLGWKDPDDLIIDGAIISQWDHTMVRYNAYAEDYDGEMSYPVSPSDGTELVVNSVRNQYRYTPYSATLEEGKIYWIRFFPCNKNNVYTIDTEHPTDNRCRTDSISWSMLNSHLENWNTESSYLPTPGSAIDVKYLINDYYMNGSTKVNIWNREDIITNVDNGNMVPVDTDWIIIGYNKTVPRYIKYRRTDESTGEYEYIFISSVDDSTTTMQFKYLDEDVFVDREIVTGNLLERAITAGCRVFTRTYDNNGTEWTYTPTGVTLSAVSNEEFVYGTGAFAYAAPLTVSIGGNTYDFHGYTMTIQPRCCLGSNSYNGYKTNMKYMEYTLGSANAVYEVFPTVSDWSRDQGYYYKDGNGRYVAIDLTTGLGGELVQDYPNDVYTINDEGQLKLMTAYYQPGILKKSIDGTNPTGNIAGHRYAKRVDNAGTITTTNLTSAYIWTEGKTYVANMYVYYNNVIYKVVSEITSSASLLPGSDESKYLTIVDLSSSTAEDNGYCVYNTKIPVPTEMMTIIENNLNTSCSLYEVCWYRFWVNDKYGYHDRDISWKPKWIFDVQSGAEMGASNGLRSRLLSELDLLKQMIPVVNPTYMINEWAPYASVFQYKNGNYVQYPTDYFFPLSMGDVLLWGNADSTSPFNDTGIYSDNPSRIKWAMKNDGTINQSSTTSGVNWWLRSPSVVNYEYYVTSSGGSSSIVASYALGVAPACTIG